MTEIAALIGFSDSATKFSTHAADVAKYRRMAPHSSKPQSRHAIHALSLSSWPRV